MRIESMILVGHSLGGYLSIAYCERYPQHIRSRTLILMSPVGIPKESPEMLKVRRRKRTESIAGFLRFLLLELVFPLLTYADMLRSFPEFVSRAWFLPRYADRYKGSILQARERLAIAEAGYYNAILPSSGERCLYRILNKYAFARNPMVDRLPKMLASNGHLRSCYFFYGDSDWMDASGGLAVYDACKANRSDCDIEVYRVHYTGHMILLANPVEFVNGLVKQLNPLVQLDSEAPLPVPLCDGRYV